MPPEETNSNQLDPNNFQTMPGLESETDTTESFFDKFKNASLIIGKILAVVILLRLFIIQPFYVRGNSMEPTFHDGEYLIVQKLSYLLGSPKRGDTVVFHYPKQSHSCTRVSNFFERALGEFIDFFNSNPETKCINFIKRVIAVGGESVDIREGKIFITNQANPHGIELKEEYTENDVATLSDALGNHFEIPKGHVFVVGDNRLPGESSDSRNWGYLPESLILGKVFVQVWPLTELGFTPQPKY